MTRTFKAAIAALAIATSGAATTASAQSVDQILFQLRSACMQGNFYACSQHDMILMEVQRQQFMAKQPAMQPAPTPGYDPNNVLGPTHQDRMRNIQAFGENNTKLHNERMRASEARQKAFLGTINQ